MKKNMKIKLNNEEKKLRVLEEQKKLEGKY